MSIPEPLWKLLTFRFIFQGREDVVGTDTGGCVRVDGRADTWDSLITGHLYGSEPIGIYPLFDNGTVAWGCVDIDEDTIEHAINLQTVLDHFGVEAWIERSRSKGYHVWVLTPGEALEATLMRKGLQAGCQIVGCPDREVNPKQVTLAAGQVGNYVRLPYPGGSWPRQVMIRPNGAVISLQDFLREAESTPVGQQKAGLVRLAEQWIDPHPPVVRVVPPPQGAYGLQTDPVRRMSSLAYILWRDGPKYPDRSAAIWRLIVELVQQGAHTEAEIVELVADADSRWGKYQQRPNGRDMIERQVRKAWG